MTDWRSCDNCGVFPLTNYCTIKTNTVICDCWKPIPCPRCGGPLSELRKYRYGGGPIGELARYHGQWYRHCYSCHGEFFLDGNKDDPPIPPNRKVFHRYTIFYCGSCGTRVFMKDRACPSCRKRIDWRAAYQTEKEEKPHD